LLHQQSLLTDEEYDQHYSLYDDYQEYYHYHGRDDKEAEEQKALDKARYELMLITSYATKPTIKEYDKMLLRMSR